MKRLVLAMLLAATAPALAQTQATPAGSVKAGEAPPSGEPPPVGMNNVVSGFGLLSYWYAESGIGVGVRYQKTIVPRGLLRVGNVRDDFGLEGGVDYFHYSFSGLAYEGSYNEIAILAGGVWNFWFLDGKLALYPKIDLGYRFGSWSASSLGGYGGFIVQGSGGVIYRLARLTLRAEAGSGSLRLGAGFVF